MEHSFLKAQGSRKFLKSPGFTMIEVLLAVTLFTLVISASYGIFSMGMQIWRRSQGRLAFERKAVFALEKMARDFRTAVRTEDKKNKGRGSVSDITVPALVKVKIKEDEMIQYGFVHYGFNSGTREICRSEISASDISSGSEPPCRVIAPHVQSLKFRYLIYDKVGDSYSWYDEWGEENEIPLAVEITLELESRLKNEKSPARSAYQRVVLIPVGEKIKEEDDPDQT